MTTRWDIDMAGVELVGRRRQARPPLRWNLDRPLRATIAPRTPIRCCGSRTSLWTGRDGGRPGRDDRIRRAAGASRDRAARAQLTRSEHVVELLDAHPGDEREPAWLVMRAARAGSLHDVFGHRAERPLADVLRFALDIVAALDDAGVVHRDLRPSNVLIGLDDAGQYPQVQVADWGRSVIHGAEQPRELAPPLVGFAAPQVVDPDAFADVRDDLFSLGAIIWWACTGDAPGEVVDHPRRGHQARAGRASLGEVQRVPPSLDVLVTTLLNVDRAARTPGIDGHRQSLSWLRTQLGACLADVENAEQKNGVSALVGPGAPGPTGRPRTGGVLVPTLSVASGPPQVAFTRDRLTTVEPLELDERSASSGPPRTGPRPSAALLAPPSPAAAVSQLAPEPRPASHVGRTDVHLGARPWILRRHEALSIGLVVLVLAFNLAAGAAIAQRLDGGAEWLALCTVVAVSLAAAVLDLGIVRRGPRIPALVISRVLIAVVLGGFAAQSLMLDVFTPEIRAGDAQRLREERAQDVNTKLAELKSQARQASSAYGSRHRSLVASERRAADDAVQAGASPATATGGEVETALARRDLARKELTRLSASTRMSLRG